MCHLLLFMPILSIPIFWIAPLNVAIPIYLVIVLISIALYWLVIQSQRKIPITGIESLLGEEAEVVSKISPGHLARYLVKSQGELWSTYCSDALNHGEKVRIAELKGISFLVERNNGTSKKKKSDL